MEREAILSALVELAEEAGIAVRRLPPAREGDPPPRSNACRLRGAAWVWIAAGDPVEDRIEAVASALRSDAAPLLEERFLPPAVRERLERGPRRSEPGAPPRARGLPARR